MNAIRKAAELKYQNALLACRAAEDQSEQAWLKANNELGTARAELIAAELQFPTNAETFRKNRELTLRNRGLDFE